MPKLAEFMESLTQEQDKLVMMGTSKPSKDQDLVAGDSRVDFVVRRLHTSIRNILKSDSSLEKVREV